MIKFFAFFFGSLCSHSHCLISVPHLTSRAKADLSLYLLSRWLYLLFQYGEWSRAAGTYQYWFRLPSCVRQHMIARKKGEKKNEKRAQLELFVGLDGVLLSGQNLQQTQTV